MTDPLTSDWPFFDDRPSPLCRRSWTRWAQASTAERCRTSDVDAACRALVAALGDAGLLRACGAGSRWRRCATARRAHALPRPRDAGLPRRARRLRLRDAGARLRADHAVRQRRAEGSATCRRWRAARRSPPSRCPSPRPAPTSPRWRRPRAATATARACIDGAKTWISNGGIADLYVVFARTGEAPGAQGHLGLRRRRRHAGPDDRRAHRRRSRRIRWRRCASTAAACPPTQPARRAGRGLQAGDGDARRLPHRRSAPRRSASRAARSTRRSSAPRTRKMFGAPLGDLQLTQAALADMATEIDAAALLIYRAAWAQGPRRAARHARGGDGQDVRHRSRAAGHRRGGAALRRPGRHARASRSRCSTARSARCASTRARPRCRSSSSPARCCRAPGQP